MDSSPDAPTDDPPAGPEPAPTATRGLGRLRWLGLACAGCLVAPLLFALAVLAGAPLSPRPEVEAARAHVAARPEEFGAQVVLEVRAVAESPAETRIEATLVAADRARPVTFHVVHEGQGWRVRQVDLDR